MISVQVLPYGVEVFFDSNHRCYHLSKRKEFSVQKSFIWGDKTWYIPSVYRYSKGLVIDYCMKIPADSIRTFIDKWNITMENDDLLFTEGQRGRIDADNPMIFKISPTVIVNGKTLSLPRTRTFLSWNPCFPEHNGNKAAEVLNHYGFDPSYGWVIQRANFFWTPKLKPWISTLSVTLEQNPVQIYGTNFHISAPGDCIEFTHPITGVQHTLTVQVYEQMERSTIRLNDDYEHPTHYTAMSYTIFPNLPANSLTITSKNGDGPRKKGVKQNEPNCEAREISVLDSIGGSATRSEIIFGGKEQGKPYAVGTGLFFHPVNDVEWQMIFREKILEDITVKCL